MRVILILHDKDLIKIAKKPPDTICVIPTNYMVEYLISLKLLETSILNTGSGFTKQIKSRIPCKAVIVDKEILVYKNPIYIPLYAIPLIVFKPFPHNIKSL